MSRRRPQLVQSEKAAIHMGASRRAKTLEGPSRAAEIARRLHRCAGRRVCNDWAKDRDEPQCVCGDPTQWGRARDIRKFIEQHCLVMRVTDLLYTPNYACPDLLSRKTRIGGTVKWGMVP